MPRFSALPAVGLSLFAQFPGLPSFSAVTLGGVDGGGGRAVDRKMRDLASSDATRTSDTFSEHTDPDPDPNIP